MEVEEVTQRRVVGGVDTHKDLHVAAIGDERDPVLETGCFATTRQGYRQMLIWMQSFGAVRCIGIESTGSYGAGLLRFMQKAGIEVLEVTAPDKPDRRRRGKNDDLDAQNAAEANGRRLMSVAGIGPIISIGMVAATGTDEAFEHGRDFGAWLSLIPGQNSTPAAERSRGASPSAGASTCEPCSFRRPTWS